MKKCMILAAFGVLAICLNPKHVAAQTDEPLAQAPTERFVSEASDVQAFAALNKPVTGEKSLRASDVSSKAIRSLKHLYKGAGEASWSAVKNAFLAEFEVDGKKSRALFTKGGYMIYGITYGAEQDLPKEERHNIKSNYVDFDITSVSEVRAEDGVYWICTLQDKDHVVVTRSHNGTLEELTFLAKYTKPKGRKGSVHIPGEAL